jgi:AraC-like DNA-binding protein
MHDLTQRVHKVPLLASQVKSAGRRDYVQGTEIRPHQHIPWELVYVIEGEIQCPIGDEVYDAQPGVLLLTPPKTVHYEICPTDWSCYYTMIDVPVAHPWPRVYHDDSNGTFGKLCSTLVLEYGRQTPDRDEMLGLILGQLDLLLRRTYSHRQLSSGERLIQDAERYIEEHFMQRITTLDLADQVGVSSSYVRRLFLRLRGRTPMAYLQALRVQHALTLIRNTNAGLDVIAIMCGYDSASHMSRHVKRTTGKSPGAFRNDELDVRVTNHVDQDQ